MSVINWPILYIPSPDQGRPLFGGQIFVGEPDLDPEIPGNQKQLSVVQEDGALVDIPQPMILSAGGVPQYLGDPVRLSVDGNYSIKILSKQGAQVYYIDNVFEGQPVTAEDGGALFVRKFDDLNLTINSTVIKDGDALNIKEYAAGNGGGAMWDVYPSGTFTPSSYVADHATLPLQLVLRVSANMSIKAFGVNAASADNSTAIFDAFSHPDTRTLFGGSGEVYAYTSNITVTGKSLTIDNCEFNGVGANITLQGSLTDLGAVNAGGLKGTKSISVGTTGGVSRGDLLIIQNMTPFSFSKHRSNYFDGEFNRIADLSGADIITESFLIPVVDYQTNCKIFKVNSISVTLNNSKFLSDNTPTYPLRLRYTDGTEVNTCKVKGGSAGALSIYKSYDVKINGGSQFNDEPAAGLQYGIAITNSQLVTINGVTAHAERHAITTGGDSSDGAVPCRYINTYDSTLSNAGSIYAADFHGNTADSGYYNNNINNDIGLAGENVSAIGNTIISGRANPPIELQEIVGGHIKVYGNKVKTSASSSAVKVVGTASNAVIANIDRDYFIDVDGISCELTSNFTHILGATNNAEGTVKNRWRLNNLTITGDDSGLEDIIKGALLNTTAWPTAPIRPENVSLTNVNNNIVAPVNWMTVTSGNFAGCSCTMPSVSHTRNLTFEVGGWISTKGGTGNGGQTVFDHPNYPTVPTAVPTMSGWAATSVPRFFPSVAAATSSQWQGFLTTADPSITTPNERSFDIIVEISMNNIVI